MFKYNVKIQKVSGRLNESVLPSKNLVVKSKTKKSDEQVFAEASKYFKKKYGLVIESADVMKNETNQYFISTWGHEQTNVDFYKVLKMSNSSVTLIEVKSKHSHNDKGWGHYSATPTDEVAPYAEPFRKKIQRDNEGIPYCKIRAGKYAHLWDGKVVNGTDYA